MRSRCISHWRLCIQIPSTNLIDTICIIRVAFRPSHIHNLPYLTPPFPFPFLLNIIPPFQSNLSVPPLRQTQEFSHQLREIRRPQTRNRIPPRRRLKPRRPAPLIASGRDIIQRARIGIQRWVDEPNTALPDRQPRLIDQRQDTAHDGGASARAVHQAEGAVDGDDVVRAVGRDVGVAAGLLGVVELRGCVGGRVRCEPALHGGGLVGGEGEDVGEAAAGEDDGFASFLGLGDGSARHDLRGADGGHVGACGREGGVEAPAAPVVVGAIGCDALAAVARNAVVA